ncbi:uncharacterized protein LOC133921714 [Phragmites australis]|uniref:uncharacterized protein LOC133921714 n=1 Tax=Phragmites australis TaxID=29695 RepID=UPI002D781F81|nr:uncharacterized protein LOC133921714 [Phragmites australis]
MHHPQQGHRRRHSDRPHYQVPAPSAPSLPVVFARCALLPSPMRRHCPHHRTANAQAPTIEPTSPRALAFRAPTSPLAPPSQVRLCELQRSPTSSPAHPLPHLCGMAPAPRPDLPHLPSSIPLTPVAHLVHIPAIHVFTVDLGRRLIQINDDAALEAAPPAVSPRSTCSSCREARTPWMAGGSTPLSSLLPRLPLAVPSSRATDLAECTAVDLPIVPALALCLQTLHLHVCDCFSGRIFGRDFFFFALYSYPTCHLISVRCSYNVCKPGDFHTWRFLPCAIHPIYTKFMQPPVFPVRL